MFLKLFLFRSVAILLGILLFIVAVEILARFFYQEPWHEKLEKMQRRSEKYKYTKNEDGLRDVDYSVTKPKITRRILILGDSFTFGLGVPKDEDTFPAILETKLNGQMIHKDIKKIEVLNGGISGSLPLDWLRLYQSISVKFDFDVVLIVFSLRDGTLLWEASFFRKIFNEITIKNRA
jgi:lysophospholipase L1-like esterase